MPIYEYACDCGQRFERLLRRADSPVPACPACGGQPRRRPPSRVALSGQSSLPPGQDQAPRSWEQTHGADRDTILHWQHTIEKRRKIEEKHPELAGDTRPVLAHEGRYAAEPLRAEHAHDDTHQHPHPHGG